MKPGPAAEVRSGVVGGGERLPLWLRVCLIAAVLATIGGGAAFYRFYREQQLSRIESKLTAIVRMKADQLTEWRRDQIQDATILQRDPFLNDSIARYLAAPNAASRADLLQRFQLLASQHDYGDIQLVDSDAAILLSLRGEENPCMEAAAAIRTVWDAPAPSPVFADFHLDPRTETPQLGVLIPLAGRGHGVAALNLVLDPTYFLYPLIESWPEPTRSAETILAERRGDLVVDLSNLHDRRDTAPSERLLMSQHERPGVMAAHGIRGFVRGRDYREVRVAAVLLDVPDTPWFLVAKIDEEEAFAPGRWSSILILTLTGAIVVSILFLGLARWQQEKKERYQGLFRSEAARRAEAERYRVTLRAIGDGAVSMDGSGRVTMLNPAAEALTGWGEREAAGRPLGEVVCLVREEGGAVADPAEKALREGVTSQLRQGIALMARDATVRPVSCIISPIRGEGGGVAGAALVIQDRTFERDSLRALEESRRRLRATLDHMMEGVQLLDRDGRYFYINAAAETHMLRSAAGLIGRRYDEAFSGDGYGGMATRVRQCLELDAVSRMELCVPGGPDGRWFDLRIQPVPGGAMVLSQDITDRKRAEEALRRSEAEYRLLVENQADLVAKIDREGRVLFASPSCCRLLGKSEEELIGNRVQDLVHEEDLEASTGAMEAIDRPPHAVYLEQRIRTGDGWTWIGWMDTAVLDDNGKVREIIGIGRDLTERRQAEEEREKLQAQLIQAQKMESVGRLAGGIAHDFNNLLSVILGYSEMLIEEAAPDSSWAEPLAEIHHAGVRARNLTRKLLAFSRKQVLEVHPIELNEMVGEYERLLHRLLGEDIRLGLTTAGEPLRILGDVTQLEQVLMNLVINARDAMTEGGTISVTTGREFFAPLFAPPELQPGEYAVIEIRDTGAGMDRETLSHLFEPFFTTKGPERGTGLGLATSYGIIRQHGGHIAVASEPGRGSTFQIFLPLAARNSADPDPGADAGEPKPQAQAAGRMQGDAAGRMQGDAAGRMQGDAAGRMQGDVAGGMQGDAAGRMQGDAAGRMQGDVADRMQGEAAGRMQGDVADRMRGDAERS
ncbi:MAG: PAS domain S-box protein [Acidobacteria bacterium]|nr:PAS domain S-box protein [Acidobacteriota bacterium]